MHCPSTYSRLVPRSHAPVSANALPSLSQKTEEGWREIFVNVDPEWTPPSTTSESRPVIPAQNAQSTPSTEPTSGLTLALSREPSTLSDILPTTSPRFEDIPVGGRVEISKDSYEMMRMVGRLVSGLEADEKGAEGGVGGVGLVVDYGKDGFSSNSFRVSHWLWFCGRMADGCGQAFRKHEIVHVFDDPGSADLTANVDFAYMKEALAGVGKSISHPITHYLAHVSPDRQQPRTAQSTNDHSSRPSASHRVSTDSSSPRRRGNGKWRLRMLRGGWLMSAGWEGSTSYWVLRQGGEVRRG